MKRRTLADTGEAMNLLLAWLGIAALTAINYGRARIGFGWLTLGGYFGRLALVAAVLIPIVGRFHAMLTW